LPAGFETWAKHNLRPQKQTDYSSVIVKLPLGDFTPKQGRGLAAIMREFTGDALRFTADQNIVLRWVPNGDLGVVFERLTALGLAEAGAETISDITSCPGTDTCKLGISSSRGLAGELRRQLKVVGNPTDDLHVKCSGCFNSCGQHHVADIGFLGVSRVVAGRRVPHFQLVVGGEWTNNAGAYGLAIGAIPSKNVPKALQALTAAFTEQKKEGEKFREWIDRFGKREVKKLVDQFTDVPPYDVDPSFYTDWGDPREYTIGDIGVGECAGEVVLGAEMGLSAAERELFEAQVLLEESQPLKASELAYRAMLQAARAITRDVNPNLNEDPQEIVSEFKKHLVDTGLFQESAAAKASQYLFRAHSEGLGDGSKESAHQLIEEGQMFVEAAHACNQRMVALRSGVAAE
jgi:sulfite reductase (ferredoxin)